MFKRTFKVVYRPIRSNFVLIPEQYYGVVSTYDNGCLNLQLNQITHYVAWAPYPGSVKDGEIGLNARAAKEIGLKENDMVKCSLIGDVMTLRNVYVTPATAADWEVIEMSSEKLTQTILDQTRIVNATQMLLIWINKSIQVSLTVDRLKPNLNYGRIDYNTELIIAPNLYKSISNASKTSLIAEQPLSQLQRRRSSTQLAPVTSPNGGNISPTSNGVASPTLANLQTEQLTRAQAQARAKRQDKYAKLLKDLQRENARQFEFRVITGEWRPNAQICDVYVRESNNLPEFMSLDAVYCMRTPADKEYYVRVRKVIADEACAEHDGTAIDGIPQTIHRTIEINAALMKLIGLTAKQRVVLKAKSVAVNFVEKLELFAQRRTHYKTLETAFKRYVVERTNDGNTMLINQEEIVQLEDDIYVTVGILPEHFRYCVIDAQFLKESKIYAADVVRDVGELLMVPPPQTTPLSVANKLIRLPAYETILTDVIKELKWSLCLDACNAVLRQGNILIIGGTGTGKTVLVERILETLMRKPYYCYYDIYHCSSNKGRKVESIQKDMRSIFTTCLSNSPSIVVLEDIDVLVRATGEQPTQDGEYFNRMADMVHALIVQYTCNDNAIAVIATANDTKLLNKRLYAPRGRHLFQVIKELPNLELNDRLILLQALCAQISSSAALNYDKLANLTEGYKKSDLVQMIERAIFYAYRISQQQPILTNELLLQALENTNSYCLQGIESHSSFGTNEDEDELTIDKVPGLESVVTVFEEIILWPAKYPKIFKSSPLRNQAGILLYGPPGTGKTFLVSKLAKSWNLRIISVKGPELLAKYIGQSEENVRNLFNRARSAKPCVLFFDEFDSLAPKRGHDSTGVTDRVVNQLLTELDGVECLEGVTLIAATSRPELLDPALLRSGRIDRLVECALPNETARLRIFEAHAASLTLDDGVDLEHFAAKSVNYTGADIQSILTSANMIAIKAAINEYGAEKLPAKVPIKQKHLLEAFSTTRNACIKNVNVTSTRSTLFYIYTSIHIKKFVKKLYC